MDEHPRSKELLKLEGLDLSNTDSSLLLCSRQGSSFQSARKDPIAVPYDGRPPIAAVTKSPVLGKVKDFLGIMAEANKKLELSIQENPESNHDIEMLNGNESEYIEMDLLLGVADLQTTEAVKAAEAAISNPHSSVPFPSANCSSDSEDSTDHDSDKENDDGRRHDETNSHEADMPNKRPKIVVLE